MNCERNICYQQDYNGGCDTCPCNDELQGCNEENGQSMTTKEIIEQLKSLKSHCEDFREDEECIWAKDVEALDRAIEALEKQATSEWIPVSERLPENCVEVLVWFEYFRYGNYNMLFQTMGISYTYNGEWSGFINGQSGWHQLSIIAWMPLPEPYKDDKQ